MKNFVLIALFAQALWSLAAERVMEDAQRRAPILIVQPDQTGLEGSGPELAQAWLLQNWQRLRLEQDAGNLVLTETKSSLVGEHFHFTQMLHGLPVDGAMVIISTNRKTGQIYQVANTTWPIEAQRVAPAPYPLEEEEALDHSWDHLKVTGEMTTLPKARMFWQIKDGAPVQVWCVDMGLSAPYGAWRVVVDSATGSILSSQNRIRHLSAEKRSPGEGDGPWMDRHEATKRLLEHQARESELSLKTSKRRADGQGMVFDPDPRTTLMAEDMENLVDPTVVEPAYVMRTLKDLTFDEGLGQFKLEGPWVEIKTIRAGGYGPDEPVTTSASGTWDYRRGNNGFNDAMTYFHLDQSQRYLQAMGFTGDAGIQDGPIKADTHGFDNDDNSFFDPNLNALAFGHGCVDDNEDADVILHEYGHAMQDWLDPRWSSFPGVGDSGAIGEGFGDYWGASYSLKTPNGPLFHPEWIYSWDGHNNCWEGRTLDRIEGIYDPRRTYDAHSVIFGTDIVGDELWSTPIFQALLHMFYAGYPMAEIDQIVVQAHFGAGSLTMAAMAQNTITAAEQLFPDGPHGRVLRESFARQEMAAHVGQWTYVSAHIPPGGGSTSWQSQIQLNNLGNSTATITATLYSNEGNDIALNVFSPISETSFTLAPGVNMVFDPPGSFQRWVRFTSDQPLAGTTYFQRHPAAAARAEKTLVVNGQHQRFDQLEPGETHFSDLNRKKARGLKMDPGLERAAIPLFSESETSRKIIFPHVPADRVRFWSGAVMVNPNAEAVNLSIQLIGENGSDLSNLVSPGTPTSLGAFQKWVTFLAPGPGGANGIFDDSSSQEKVSYMVLTASKDIAGFQLFGYQLGVTDEVATSGIMAMPDQNRSSWPVRVALTDVEWSGFTVLNPGDSATDVDIRVLDPAGKILAQTNTTIQPRQKLLGLNQASGFQFPSNGTPIISLPNGANIQTVLITNDERSRTFGVDQPLRIFNLAGDLAGSQLDGGAVTSLANQVVFNNPSGKLELFKAEYDGDLRVIFSINGKLSEERITLAADASAQMDIGSDVEFLIVKGQFFTATVIDRNADERALTIINGKQADWTTDGESTKK